MKVAFMNPEYEYYGTYNKNAAGDINLEGQQGMRITF